MKTQNTENQESEVRSYSRSYSGIFSTAKGSHLFTEDGGSYVDFLSGCGSLNYGHNNEKIREQLLRYIEEDGITLGLDMQTKARVAFLSSFSKLILQPRGLNHRIQFTGPTGSNAVEAAIKIARKATNRTNIIAFTNGFHGCSLGALSLTANSHHRKSSGPLLNWVHHAPYDGYHGDAVCTVEILRKQLFDPSGGIEPPAAFIVEAVQGDGGLNSASKIWLQKLAVLAKDVGALLILDEIQSGCGRTGTFFSFEYANIVPDIITLAKSISGFGLPMSLVLMKPEVDVWKPGEHNGTFRGNNHAFVTAKATLDLFWSSPEFERGLLQKSVVLKGVLDTFCKDRPFLVKGRGLMLGVDLLDSDLAERVKHEAYSKNIIIELCGTHDQILKLLPPLTMSEKELIKETKTLLDIVDRMSSGSSFFAEIWRRGQVYN